MMNFNALVSAVKKIIILFFKLVYFTALFHLKVYIRMTANQCKIIEYKAKKSNTLSGILG